jgi:hypothetical protein
MKNLLSILAVIASLALLLSDDFPAPTPYEPTDNPAQRVHEFIRGERDSIDEADLHAPSVPNSLRRAALNLTR